MHPFTAESPPNRPPPLPEPDCLLYYQTMKRRKRPPKTAVPASWLVAGFLAIFPLFAQSASADIFRWEDESGVIHFTDDVSSIPPKFRGKSREIQRTPPEAGKPSVSTMGAPSPPPARSPSSMPANGDAIDRPAIPRDDDATLAEKLRAKIDAKERFIREVDQKQSLAVNPYRNRFVSPPDMDLYRKYKDELPGDRERLKELESRLTPVKEP